ncbi:MAG: hypothetical protein F6K00_12450 [Leptolyngbya sp. SIOISBB]|nr:hypothetical protein [Leptolyngbya sp. SIOISBB]
MNLLNHTHIVKVFAIQTEGNSTMTCLFQRHLNYLAYATILTAGLTLIQSAAAAQTVPNSADLLLGGDLVIGYGDGMGGALLSEPESHTLGEIAQEINNSLEREFSDRLTVSAGNLEFEGYPQPEQMILVRPDF